MDPVTAVFILVLFIGLMRYNKAKKAVVEQTVMPTGIYPYEKKDFLLMKLENNFYNLLRSTLGNKFTICLKVDVEDLIAVKKNISKSAKSGYINKVNNQSVDFVLCSPKDLKVICAIMLDKKLNAQEQNIESDKFVDLAFKAASLPLIRFKLSATYNEKAIVAALKKGINDVAKAEKPEAKPE